MDAFKNYQALMSGIGSNVEQAQKNAKQEALFNAKSRADEIVKTVGEAKVFLSGKPIINKVGAYLKPKLKEGLDNFKKEAEEKFGNLVKGKLPGESGAPEPPPVNAEAVPNNAGPSRLDELRQNVANREKEAQKAKDAEQAEKDANDAAEARGAKDAEPTGEEETFEMQDIGASKAAQEIPNRAFDPSAADEEVGETAAGEAGGGTDIATGLEGGFNASSDPVFSSVMSQSRGANLQNPFANARQNKFNPDEEDGQSASTPRSQPADPETQPTADAPASGTQAGADAGDAGADAGGGGAVAETDIDAAIAKSAAEKAAAEAAAKSAAEKTAAEAGGEAAGGEAAGGILDAIPGGQVLGLLVGAIMAGVAAHKAHKAEEEEKATDVAGNNPTSFSYQSGVGTD
tara:strand:+ start:3917 stop:5122 length:1206 start_codon:yes stop_codon:yes gene_type:complete